MPDPRHIDEDNRLQRLADLSIEVRMLKARVQEVIDERVGEAASDSAEDGVRAFRTVLNAGRCRDCVPSAGWALLPREYRRLSTLVRCFSCRRDALAFDWVGAPANIQPPPGRRL